MDMRYQQHAMDPRGAPHVNYHMQPSGLDGQFPQMDPMAARVQTYTDPKLMEQMNSKFDTLGNGMKASCP